MRGNGSNGPRKAVKPVPPGPRGHWLMGIIPEANGDELGYLARMVNQYGDIVRYRFGRITSYLLNHPDYVRHVLVDNNRCYSKQSFSYNLLRPVLGEGLLTSEGDFWLRQRRLMQPTFHRQRVQRFGTVMTDATHEMLARWEAPFFKTRPFDVAEEMMRLTLRIAGKALFSLDLNNEAETVGRAFTTVNEGISDLTYIFIPLSWPIPRNLRYRAAIQTLNNVVDEIIRERRIQVERANGSGPQDLLAMLLQARDEHTGEGMTDRQLRDEVMTLMLAGHETTANALTWTWYLLSKNPIAAQSLRQELAQVLGGRTPSVENLPDLPYTRMVIREALRLYPPAWFISRRAEAWDEIGAYPIEPGMTVNISPYLMHRHPRFWKNPEGFDPLRFTPERSSGRPAYAYFPFGGGPRQCIGRDFALIEAQLILATIAQKFSLHLLPGHPVEPEPLVTLRPKYGLRMTLHPVGQRQAGFQPA